MNGGAGGRDLSERTDNACSVIWICLRSILPGRMLGLPSKLPTCILSYQPECELLMYRNCAFLPTSLAASTNLGT